MFRFTNAIPEKNEQPNASQKTHEIFNNYFSKAVNLDYQWSMENLSESGVQITLTSISMDANFSLQSLNKVIQQQYKHINTMFFEENDSGFLQFCCNSTEDALSLTETITKLAQTKNTNSKMFLSALGYNLEASNTVNSLDNLPMINSKNCDFYHFLNDEPVNKTEKHDLSNFLSGRPTNSFFSLSFNQPDTDKKTRRGLFSSKKLIKKTDENEIKNENVKQRIRQSHEIIQFEIRRRLEVIDENYHVLWELSKNEDNKIVVKLQSKNQRGVFCLEKLNKSMRGIELKGRDENRNYQELEFICKSPEVACNFGRQLVSVFKIPPESYKRKFSRVNTSFWNNKEVEKSEENINSESTHENKIRKTDNCSNSFPKDNNNNLPPDNDDKEDLHYSPTFGGTDK